MIASDVTSWAQQECGEQNVGQRWSASQWLAATDRAQKAVIRELKWPPSRMGFTTIPGVQEYQLQEVIKIDQVYVNGQIVVQADLATLEGQQIQLNDQNGSVGGPTGLVSPVNAPVVGGGQYTPAWSSQAPAAYPVANSQLGAPSPSAQPWMIGQRPRYYANGGNIGFVPVPIAAYPVIIRCIRNPVQLVAPTDVMTLPDVCLDAIGWKVCEFFYYADRNQSGADDNRNYANAEYQKALLLCKDWKRTYDGSGPVGPKPLTYRSFFTQGQNRIGNR